MKLKIVEGLLLMLAVPFTLSASLGGDTTSVQADVAKMQGSLRSSSESSYTVHEIQMPTGVTVKEFVGQNGRVFAVSWTGPVHPDLRQLLGAYFDPYIQAVQELNAQRHGHGPVIIDKPGLMARVSGHMRAFQGRVYVPQLVPAGVHAEELR